MRRSEEIPFSRSRTRTASRISLLMRSALQQVASVDVRVRDRYDARVSRHRDLAVARTDELAREGVAAGGGLSRGPTARAARAGRRRGVWGGGGWGGRPRRAGRRHLERVVQEQLAKVGG